VRCTSRIRNIFTPMENTTSNGKSATVTETITVTVFVTGDDDVCKGS